MVRGFENWYRKRFLEYLELQIDVFKIKFAHKHFHKIRVFRVLMRQTLTKNEKSPNHPKLVLAYSRICFQYFFDINGAQHSSLALLATPTVRRSRSSKAQRRVLPVLASVCLHLFALMINWIQQLLPSVTLKYSFLVSCMMLREGGECCAPTPDAFVGAA